MKNQTEIISSEVPMKIIGWRNFYISLKDHHSAPSGTFHPESSIFPGRVLHSSREEAVAGAQGWLERNSHFGVAEYIGPFEVGS